jgi:hypothetical protein
MLAGGVGNWKGDKGDKEDKGDKGAGEQRRHGDAKTRRRGE